MGVLLGSRLLRSVVVVVLLISSGGCTVLDVDMTSTPDSVRVGEPVTFDIKLTNRSQCPLALSAAELLAFIPADRFLEELIGDVPADLPPEVETFLEQIRAFFDELCSGGEPDLPELPELAASCRRGDEEILCRMSSALGAQQGSSGGMTFAGLGNRLRCEIDEGTMSCVFRFPLAKATSSASGSGATATGALTCLTGEELGEPEAEPFALCFVGTFPPSEGLGPSEMATGRVMLPARGEGFVRNIVIGIAVDEDEIGVCKDGSEGGKACDPTETDPCPGSTCGAGICVGGNDGMGCDAATEGADCGAGTCELCNDLTENDFLPIDCTTTYIAPQTAPVMSPWGLAGLAALLLVSGSLWLHRRGRRAARS